MSEANKPSGALGAVSRRVALQGLGLGVGLGMVPACAQEQELEVEGSAAREGAAGSNVAGTSNVMAWATGGTAAMLTATSYPDPFQAEASECPLTCALTLGPCWAPTAPVRQDISEQEPGVPLRLALRVVDSDGCTPLQGAEVEIWYCNTRGIYSAENVQGGSFCNSNDEAGLAGYFFRGRAIADSDGKLVFDGCYPGWYPGRAVHIHVLVRPAANAGEGTANNAVAVSQIFFPDELTTEIFSSVQGYADKGQPDTNLSADNALSSLDDVTPYIVEYQQMTDGAMLAWKTIAVSPTQQCGRTAAGGGGFPPGGPSGRPADSRS